MKKLLSLITICMITTLCISINTNHYYCYNKYYQKFNHYLGSFHNLSTSIILRLFFILLILSSISSILIESLTNS